MKKFLIKDMYTTDSPDIEFFQNNIKEYIEEKDEKFYVDFLSNFDEEKYISYIHEAISSLEDFEEKELENKDNFHFFDFWMNSAIEIFTDSLWQSTYNTTRGNDSHKTQTANVEIESFKEYMELYTIEKNIEEGTFQTLH